MAGERKRRICWPFDAVCLQGGCSYCADNPPRHRSEIWAEAKRLGLEDDYRLGCDIGGPGKLP
ncbi:MAG: hypothetical protein JF597_01280 [Streptomyces sp.]|uniref:hypothetical protein n=1 Tax=Streptomyces sp. TaxID=1931 RepID=UPI0025DA545C|nr:hypothetical protein [Streptomyces sp.]MBW8792266.1 hypothetical protein [Streptomyces sp.]